MKKTALFSTLILMIGILNEGCKNDNFVPIFGECPVVTITSPTNASTSVPLDKIIKATFNETMDSTSFTTTSFTLMNNTISVPGTVSYNGLVASFNPSSPLLPNTTYHARIKKTVKDLLGTNLQADYDWTFSTGTTLSFQIIETDPLNLATDVVLNKTITATFNLPIDSASMNSSNFILTQGATVIAGTVLCDGVIANFKPNNPLSPNTLYTVTITTDVKDKLGAALVSNYVWTFTTGTTMATLPIAPTVTSIDPGNGDINVALNKVISATFSAPMNSLSLNTNSFTLKTGNVMVSGAVNCWGSTANFVPITGLLANTIYTATITKAAKNQAGTPMVSNYSWTFTTGMAVAPTVKLTDPNNMANNVALNKIITATFSENMDAASLTSSSFVLKAGNTTINGTVSCLNATASFTPNSVLVAGTTYTATISTGAKNLVGTSLSGKYQWSFTTIGGALPFVDLKTVDRFGIISGVGVSNNAGASIIRNLDVGIYPGTRSSITGFPPATIVNGQMFAADDGGAVAVMLQQAKLDLVAAYLFAEGASSPAPQTVAGNQGGKTLAPGIYKSTSTLSIDGSDLTLDAQGNPDAFWIFQIASSFTTTTGGNVKLIGGAQAKNVFWQTGSSATIGTYTTFNGNILALQSITMSPYATAVGRMLARNGAVVMTSTNSITKP